MHHLTSRERHCEITALPKADLHLHQERLGRARQLAAVRGDSDPDDWAAWRERIQSLPPGMPRLQELWDSGAPEDERNKDAARLDRFELTLAESAAAGSVLTELRVGNELLMWPPIVATLREAERRVRQLHPFFHAELVGRVKMWQAPTQIAEVVRACLRLAREGAVDRSATRRGSIACGTPRVTPSASADCGFTTFATPTQPGWSRPGST